MKKLKESVLFFSLLIMLALSACTGSASSATQNASSLSEETTTAADATGSSSASLAFDNAAWQYDSDNDVYYQIGVQYCTNPEAVEYETLGIYVPGTYMDASDNGDGTYTLSVNSSGAINGYTAATAPIVFPVNTPGYSAQAAPTSYNYTEVASYLQAGMIYVYAGMRGRDNGYDSSGNLTYSGGAPWGVTDLKAAIRYIRYNKAVLPGATESIFVFGMSGGGAQSAIIGASGDSELYTPYLESIGAAMTNANGQALSDAVAGVMAWCPITSLDYANAAYEWNMGQFATTGTRADSTWTSALSDDLAAAFAEYINQLGLTDESRNVLTLEESSTGIYLTGSYYDYLVSTIQQSLNNFLADTTFPYTQSSGGAMAGGDMPRGGTPPSGDLPGGTPPAGIDSAGSAPSSTAESSSTTYQTAQEYIDALNTDTQWVAYDSATNTATVTSLAGFVQWGKNASKSVPAFDALDRSQAENNVFGNDASDSLHFDPIVADLLASNQAEYASFSDWDASLVDVYASDLEALDKLGNSLQIRLNMYNPMYYLIDYYDGYQTSSVAPYWRINTGIEQGDTANTVEMNLALALENFTGVQEVEFTTVWGMGHAMAERTGDSTTNFIEWVNQVVQ